MKINNGKAKSEIEQARSTLMRMERVLCDLILRVLLIKRVKALEQELRSTTYHKIRKSSYLGHTLRNEKYFLPQLMITGTRK